MNISQSSDLAPKPQSIPGCPPGLEYLTMVDQILINQRKECMEIVSGWEERNKYRIRNTVGQQVYYAQEESTCAQRSFCGSDREYILHITDNYGAEVMRICHDLSYCTGFNCTPSCTYRVKLESVSGEVIGYVWQDQTWCAPALKVLDANQELILYIQGPYCVCDWCSEFAVQTADKSQQIGTIRKRWSGLAKETFSDADNFGVNFPMDLDAKAKALLIAATFVIDFMFYEGK